MTPTAWLIVAIISLIFSALFSGVEIAFISSDRVRVELDAQRGGLIGKLISRFYSDEDLFISTLLVGNNIVLVVYGMGAAAIIEPWLEVQFSSQAVVLLFSTLISTGVILITGEFLPKSIFRINPNLMFKIFSLPIFMFYIVLYPVSLFISALSKGIMKLFGIHAEAQRMGVLSVGDLNQFLETAIDEVNPDKAPVENEVKIFHNALDFSSTHLRDCMQPRREIVAVDIDETSRDQLSELFTSSGRSKIIVYREKVRLEALRGVKKEFLEAKTAKGANGELTDETATKIMVKMVKQRKESAKIYEENNRPELAANELEEAAVIEEYLPKQLSPEELEAELKAIIAETGATGPKETGKVMGVATKRLAGRAEGKLISAKVKELLA